MTRLDVPLPPADQVDEPAAKPGRVLLWPKHQVLGDALELAAERYRMTTEALAGVDAAAGVSHDDVVDWAATLGTDKRGTLPE